MATPLTILSLPDVCLLHIFDLLPLSDLATVGDVCDHWCTLQHTIFTRRGILTALFGSAPYNLVNSSYFSYPSNSSMIVALHGTSRAPLEAPGLDHELIQTLIRDYPNRISVEISINSLDSCVVPLLIELLESYCSTLTSLKLWIRFAAPDRSFSLSAKNQISSHLFTLIATINRLSKLTHLTLDIHNQFTLGIESQELEDDNLEVQLELPILAQLREFYIYSLNGADSLIDSLKRYAEPNPKLAKIGLRNSVYSAECMGKFLELSPALLSKFTHLNTHQIARYHLDEFSAKFRSLVTLSTTVIQATLPLLFKSLSALPNLADLRLYIYFEESQPRNPEEPVESSARLPTVKSLSLYGGISSHNQMRHLSPGWTFPTLTEVRLALSLYGCPDCGYQQISRITAEQREECYRLMVRPWIEQCPHLKEAYIFNVQIPLANGLTQSQVYMINQD